MKQTKGFKKSKLIVAFLAAILIIESFVPVAKAMENTYYDDMYYNTGLLTDYERETLTDLPQGTVIIMSPVDDDFYYGAEAEALIVDGSVTIVSIAGVGSSSVGTAALAKHIAVASDEYVAGIVAGLGVKTMPIEGPEGYFIGRSSNVTGIYYEQEASAKLAELYDRGARPTALVGHSKGNMDLANALYKLKSEGHSSYFSGVEVITFGCGVYLPSGVGTVDQYVGNLDSLGMTNTTINWFYVTWVIGAYHTTNPYYSLTYMPIENYVDHLN